MNYTFLFLIALLYSISPLSAQNWEKAAEKKGIVVYTRQAKASDFKEFKADVTIDAPIERISEIIFNVEAYPLWAYKTALIKVIKKENNAVYFYFLSDVPPFIKEREAYYFYERKTDELSKTIRIAMTTYESKLPVPENKVRLAVSNGTWTLQPISPTRTKVTFEMQAEPGGSIPAWLANLVVLESPMVTLEGLRQLVAKNK
jgi:hypothetical protein